LKLKPSGALLGALLLTVAALAPAAPATAAEPKNLQVMSWNMCGSQRASWGCAGTGTPQNKIDVVKHHVAESFVQAALLQEVCENDLTLLMSQLGSGWSKAFQPYQWSEDGVRGNNTCGETGGRQDRIGTAIVIKAGMASPQAYTTTQPWTGQNRPFHCATATYWNIRLCNAHLTPAKGNPNEPTWEYADDQLAEIKRITGGFPNVVIGGDFNVEPPYYAGNARGWLWPAGFYATAAGAAGYAECDRGQDRDTHDGGWKIDYIFSSETKRWCGVGNSAYSDHHVVLYSIEVV
jgi:endonuclease/exonuclease/phosphatase family metal-dependent hydrolase